MAPLRIILFTLLLLLPVSLHAEDGQDAPRDGACEDREAPCLPGLRMNDIQAVGSHNSYKKYIPETELELLASTSREAALALDYGHQPLQEQLDLGMRQLELDVFYDPYGARYAEPILPKISAGVGGEPYDASGMHEPGFKVLHAQDIDVHSHCKTFILCLEQIDEWSRTNPDHLPILVLINTKQAPIDQVPGAVVPFPFTAEAFDALDREIRSVLDETRLITPDDVRGEAETLRDAIIARGWPSLEDARGKILFALDNNKELVAIYRRGRASLEGLAMFVNSHDPSADDAAYMTLNNPVRDGAEIRSAVETGFLVRTRADANTMEARGNDTRRREAAFASGAHYISTDYYLPRTELSPYQVTLPEGGAGRCNPVRVETPCDGATQ